MRAIIRLNRNEFLLHNPSPYTRLRNAFLQLIATNQRVVFYLRLHIIEATGWGILEVLRQLNDMCRNKEQTSLPLLQQIDYGNGRFEGIAGIRAPKEFIKKHKAAPTLLDLLQHLFDPQHFGIKMTPPAFHRIGQIDGGE